MITQEEHLSRILHLVSPLPITEAPLTEALSQTLAANVTATVDLPPWDAAAMDGYAVSLKNFTPGTLPVRKIIAAGHKPPERLGPGEVAAIMTGAPVPDGADTIVPLEHFHDPTQDLPHEITFDDVPEEDQHIRRRAEDTRAGEIVAAAGTVLHPNHIGAIAAAGTDTVFIARQPKVAVISTGNELVAPGTPLEHGQIPDSNAPLVAATLRRMGAEPTHQIRVRDSEASLEHTIAQLEHTVDAIVLTGGASVGAHDISNYVLSAWQHEDPELAITFTNVNIRPGRPQGFGLSPAGTPVWSLPGNPVAVLVSLRLFVVPGLAKMQRQAPHPRKHTVVTTAELHTPKELNYYVLAVVDDDDRATPLASNSHLATNMAQATGLLHVPPHVDHVAADQTVEYLAL
jgi:molybdopterin molybdotransferase